MLKKRIQFKDLDGNTIEEDFYFNLNKGELADIELSVPGGLAAYAKIVAADAQRNPAPLMDLFNMIIEKSYGVRGDDGRQFRKSPEIFQAFKDTDAYSEFRWWLFRGGAETISEFFNAVVGEALGGKTMEELAASQGSGSYKLKDRAEDYTVDEMTNMSLEELRAIGRKFKHNLPKGYLPVAQRRLGDEKVLETTGTIPKDTRPAWLIHDRYPDEAELKEMSKEDFLLYQTDLYRLMHKNK